MTAIVLLLATAVRTPVGLWVIAMLCDTAMVLTFMTLRAFGKL